MISHEIQPIHKDVMFKFFQPVARSLASGHKPNLMAKLNG